MASTADWESTRLGRLFFPGSSLYGISNVLLLIRKHLKGSVENSKNTNMNVHQTQNFASWKHVSLEFSLNKGS